jgi:ComF family protein
MLPSFVRAGRSVCWEQDPARPIVHALKYDGWTRVADEMALRMSRLSWPEDVLAERAALIPVPLAAARERERGFNQSVLLARALGRLWGLPAWEHVLVRSRRTVSQTQLTPDQRRDNVRGAFRATATRDLSGRHVILVDDVVTTAATLNACASALMAGGARIVSFVTFGRAPALGDRC